MAPILTSRRSPRKRAPTLPSDAPSPAPLPLARAPRGAFAAVKGVLFDVDDTFTSHGALHASTYAALEAARDAGLWLCAVTGRGAGWCDMMVRLWPVHAVVGETGAFAYVKRADGTIAESFLRDEATRKQDFKRRDAAVQRVLAGVKGARLSRDSAFRICDLAFDLKEDGPPLPEPRIQHIMSMLAQDGLTVARSSVHINTWMGSYGKREMVEVLLRDVFGARVATRPDAFVYVGDSRNDGPMFAHVPLSVGVANVSGVLEELRLRGQAPRYVTRASMGDGMKELLLRIMRERKEAGRGA